MGVRAPTYDFWKDTIQPVTPTKTLYSQAGPMRCCETRWGLQQKLGCGGGGGRERDVTAQQTGSLWTVGIPAAGPSFLCCVWYLKASALPNVTQQKATSRASPEDPRPGSLLDAQPLLPTTGSSLNTQGAMGCNCATKSTCGSPSPQHPERDTPRSGLLRESRTRLLGGP